MISVGLVTRVLVGFSTSRHWYSSTIREVTSSQCSHTFLVFPFRGRNLIAEEGDIGWSIRTLDALLETDTLIALLEPKVCLDKGFDESLKDLGQKYGWWTLFGFAWVMLWRRFGKKVRNPLASSHSMVCSERVVSIMRASGDLGALQFDPASTTPQDLLTYLSA